MVSAEQPRQRSLRRLRQYAIRPNRELGQNFLVDDNILRLIGRLAELAPDDVVLEVVANLPYGIAASVVLKSIDELDAARLWVAMVQREVAERLAADTGSKVYGATSVLAQLACEVRIERRVPASVFHPAPNVESALVVLRRTAPAPSLALRSLVHAAFAHRRKALARSLALTPGAPAEIRERARDALIGLGQPPDARAEALSPADFAALAELIGGDGLGALAPR
jgi:16S rRNA (adenine1518-N6/adenine1519-N6)-dimethyltransferase